MRWKRSILNATNATRRRSIRYRTSSPRTNGNASWRFNEIMPDLLNLDWSKSRASTPRRRRSETKRCVWWGHSRLANLLFDSYLVVSHHPFEAHTPPPNILLKHRWKKKRSRRWANIQPNSLILGVFSHHPFEAHTRPPNILLKHRWKKKRSRRWANIQPNSLILGVFFAPKANDLFCFLFCCVREKKLSTTRCVWRGLVIFLWYIFCTQS